MLRPRTLLAPARYATSRRLLKGPPIHNGRLRRFSTPAADGSLPLEGYRVLDMTRVLAGVGAPKFRSTPTLASPC